MKKNIVIAAIVLVVLLVLALTLPSFFKEKEEERDPGYIYIDEDEYFIICLDPGHGGNDPGGEGADGRMEKDDVLMLAYAVEQHIYAMEIENVKVIFTRTEDENINTPDGRVSLEQRYTYANDNNASIFISLHRNLGGGKGVEVWIQNESSILEEKLGGMMMDYIQAVGITSNRGLRKGTAENNGSDYAVNRGTKMPACLIELGFMDYEEDNRYFDEYYDEYAKAIAEAIMEMKK